MIIAFCGHRDAALEASESKRLEEELQEILRKDPAAVFYLGDYGVFDKLCNNVLKKLQIEFPRLKRIFVTPYIYPEYSRFEYAKEDYDEIIYPFEERVMPKYAIVKRNKGMVDKSDCIISYVKREWGGAYSMLEYAIKKGKSI